MLNGTAPLIVFTFVPPLPDSLFNTLSGIPIVGDLAIDAIGIPLPIYLDERTTNLYVTGESRSIANATEVNGKANASNPKVNQWGLKSSISIRMLGTKDSVALNSLTSFCDMAFSRLVSKNYRISYFNKNIVVLGGYLENLEVETSNEDDLVQITLEISKANKGGAPEDTDLTVGRNRGPLPT